MYVLICTCKSLRLLASLLWRNYGENLWFWEETKTLVFVGVRLFFFFLVRSLVTIVDSDGEYYVNFIYSIFD